MPGGPAYEHLEPGDILVRVNGEVSLFDWKSCPLPRKYPLHFLLTKDCLHPFFGFSVSVILCFMCILFVYWLCLISFLKAKQLIISYKLNGGKLTN